MANIGGRYPTKIDVENNCHRVQFVATFCFQISFTDSERRMAIDYYEINARAIDLLLSVKKHASSIDEKLKSIVELRVSQINGCSYCVDLHSNEARNAGESQQRLDCLPVWNECSLFSDRELVALQWAESVTNISAESCIEEKLSCLLEFFTEKEAVDLTVIVSLMNCMNRMAISFGEKPRVRN